MFIILISFITGGLITLLVILNAKLAQKVGLLRGTFINYLVGVFFSLLTLLIFDNLDFQKLKNLLNVPWWAFLGGIVGIFVVILSNLLIPKIPVVYSTIVIFLGQLFMGYLIDFLNGNMHSINTIIGGLFIVIGLFLYYPLKPYRSKV